MSKPRTKCVFCGIARKMTKQHIIPDRLRNILPRIATAHTLSIEEHRWIPGAAKPLILPSSEDHEGHLGTKRYRVVCEVCNGGWIKAAEDEAFKTLEGLINGRPLLVAPQEQASIAVACAVMFCMIDRTEDLPGTILQNEREALRETLALPPTWLLYWGRSNSPGWQFRYAHFSAILGPKNAGPFGKDSNFHVATIGIGNLVLHFIAWHSAAPPLSDPFLYARNLGLARLPSDISTDFSKLKVQRDDGMHAAANRLVDALESH
jgi:hypothetical protein